MIWFDYAIIRVVPRVEREEFLNVGAIIFSPTARVLCARIEFDEARFEAFAPHADRENIKEHLQLIPRICAGGSDSGPIGQMSPSARFHWLVAPRSTLVQCSTVHGGCCETIESAIEDLLDKMVRLPKIYIEDTL